MADLLRRIERAGSTQPLLYAVRDVRGVEAPAANPPDRTGFNEEAEWTERADGAGRNQHRADGTHGSWQFPRCVVFLSCFRMPVTGDTDWILSDDSWRDDVRHAEQPVASIVAVPTGGSPWLALQFAAPLPATIAVEVEHTTQPAWSRAGADTILVAPGPTPEGLWHLALTIYEAD